MTIYFSTNLPNPVNRLPSTNAVWPVFPKRSVIVCGRGRKFGSRGLGARRSNGTRCHAGIDIFAKYRDKVLAIEDVRL